jgi:hypothetical protein
VENPVAKLVVGAVVTWAAVGGLMDACLFEGNRSSATPTPAAATTAATGSVPNVDMRSPTDLPGWMLCQPNPAWDEMIDHMRYENRVRRLETAINGGHNGPSSLTCPF